MVQSPDLCHSTSFLVLKGMIYVARVNPEVFLKIQASLNRFNTENLNSREGEPREVFELTLHIVKNIP